MCPEFSVVGICWQPRGCAMKNLLKNAAQINICEEDYGWKSLPCPSPSLDYITVIRTIISLLNVCTHILHPFIVVQNLEERIHGAFVSEDDPGKEFQCYFNMQKYF